MKATLIARAGTIVELAGIRFCLEAVESVVPMWSREQIGNAFTDCDEDRFSELADHCSVQFWGGSTAEFPMKMAEFNAACDEVRRVLEEKHV